jgi:urease accessory protein
MNRTQRTLFFRRFLTLAVLAVVGSPAWAHEGHGELSRFVAAAVHPWTGADHVLSALVTGMVGAHVGGRRGAAVLFAYLGGLLTGALLFGSAPPWLQAALGISVTVMGLMLLQPAMAGARLAICMAAGFAALHGMAHFSDAGGQVPVAAAAGLALSTGLLLLTGLGLQAALRLSGVAASRVAWPLAATGAMLVLGTF